MIFRFIIIAMISTLLLYGLSQWKRSHVIAGSIVTVSAAGLLLALFPSISQDIADVVGIGRGADLMFYIFIIVTLMALANIHVRMRRQHDLVTQIARELALSSAQESPHVKTEPHS